MSALAGKGPTGVSALHWGENAALGEYAFGECTGENRSLGECAGRGSALFGGELRWGMYTLWEELR